MSDKLCRENVWQSLMSNYCVPFSRKSPPGTLRHCAAPTDTKNGPIVAEQLYLDLALDAALVHPGRVKPGVSPTRLKPKRIVPAVLPDAVDDQAVPTTISSIPLDSSPRPVPARPVTTLADLAAVVAAHPTLTPMRKRDQVSAIRTIARLLGANPMQLPADPRLLRKKLANVHPAAVGMSVKRFANVRADVLQALNLGAPGITGRYDRSPLTSLWRSLYEACPTSWIRMKLSRFMRWCSHHGITPSEVSMVTLDRFLDELDRKELALSPAKLRRAVASNWNICVEQVPNWPKSVLEMIPARVAWTLPWEAFTFEFQQDVEACMTRLGGADLLDEDGPDKPLRPITLNWRRFQARMAASALVGAGVAVTEIKSIADVVTPVRFRMVLNALLQRYGGKTAHIYGLATALKSIARHHCKLGDSEIEVLRGLCRRVLVKRRGLTTKNRDRLRPFTDPAVRDQLLLLPQKLMHQAERMGSRDRKAAFIAQMAVALEIAQMAPLRAANLSALEVGRQLVFIGSGRDQHAVITLPKEAVKNEISLEYPLPVESTRLIKRYFKDFLPLLGKPGSMHLFPGPSGGGKLPMTLSKQISKAIWGATGQRVHLHLLRHFAAMVFLQDQPGAYAAVQRILGHTTSSAAINSYVGLESAAAAKHFDDIVLRHRRQAAKPPVRRGRRL